MKRIIYLGVVLSVLMLFACGKASVEDAAKEYVKKQCAFDNNVSINTSKLKYTVMKKEGNRATVKVSGAISIDGQLFLVKSGSKWKIGKKENVYEKQIKPVSHTEQNKAVSHPEQTTSHQQVAHQ